MFFRFPEGLAGGAEEGIPSTRRRHEVTLRMRRETAATGPATAPLLRVTRRTPKGKTYK